MPVEIQSTMKPRNNGKFPLMEAEDILVADGKRLDDAIIFGRTNAGKFLVVGDDGMIKVSGVSVGSPIVTDDPRVIDTALANATEADIGKAYLYVGTDTDTYKNGALYAIAEE